MSQCSPDREIQRSRHFCHASACLIKSVREAAELSVDLFMAELQWAVLTLAHAWNSTISEIKCRSMPAQVLHSAPRTLP